MSAEIAIQTEGGDTVTFGALEIEGVFMTTLTIETPQGGEAFLALTQHDMAVLALRVVEELQGIMAANADPDVTDRRERVAKEREAWIEAKLAEGRS